MKARRIVIMTVSLVLCFSLMGFAAFRIITSGREYVDTDGIRKHTRFYMENAYCENGTIHFTVVNDSCEEHSVGGHGPYVEYKENGVWRPLDLQAPLLAVSQRHKPFSRSEQTLSLRYIWIEDSYSPPKFGECRLIYGDPIYEEDGYGFRENGVYLIAYLTITEDMLYNC